MKIRLLDYLNNEHFVEIPNDTDRLVIDVISGDMVMKYPFLHDTSNERIMNFMDGTVYLDKDQFDKLNEVESSLQLLCYYYGYE